MPSAIIDHGDKYEIIYNVEEGEDEKIIDKPYQLKTLFPGEIATIQNSTPEQVQRILSRLYTNE